MALSLLASGGSAADYRVPGPVTVFDVHGYIAREEITDPRHRADLVHFLTTLQGLANRELPRLYLLATFNLFQVELSASHPEYPQTTIAHLDKFWLDDFKARGWLREQDLVHARSLPELMQRFSNDVKGLVQWELAVPATINGAQTAGGVELLLPVRKDAAPDGFQSRVTRELPGLAVKLDLAGAFTGQGTVKLAGVEFSSTGSAKNDVYRFLYHKYCKTRRLSPFYMWYNCDALDYRKHTAFYNKGAVANALNRFRVPSEASTLDLQHNGLYNADYWVARKGLIVDLSPWHDEIATDDPGAPVGLDVETWDLLLGESYRQRKGAFGVCAGFLTWWLKYTSHAGIGGNHEPVPGEWQFVRRLTSYNMVNDGDAAFGIANCSFFQHLPSLTPGECEHPPLPEEKFEEGTTYLCFFMLDYDGSAWVNQLPTAIYNDPARGNMPLNWAINPVINDRIPHAMRFLHEKRTENDIFGLEDDGVGYIDPQYLDGKRLGSVQESGIPQYERFAAKYHRSLGIKYTAFYIAPGFSSPWIDMAARLTPGGFGSERIPRHRQVNGTPVTKVHSFHHNDIKRLETYLDEVYRESTESRKTAFRAFRVILMPPTLLVNAIAKMKEEYPQARVKVMDAPNYFKLLGEFVKPVALPAGLDTISLVLDREPAATGLGFVERNTESKLVPVQKVGRWGWQSVARRGMGVHRYVYLTVEYTEFRAGGATAVDVNIDYFDEGTFDLQLVYDSGDTNVVVTAGSPGAWKSAGTIVFADSGIWTNASFAIEDAWFDGRCNGADFRLQSAAGVDYTLGSVAVSRR
jgi:hypothetical protein